MSERFIVEGLAGQKKLSGSIAVKGAKNAVVAALPASLLFEDTFTVTNVPAIEDVGTESEILKKLGAEVAQTSPGTYAINTSQVASSDLDDAIARKIRASIVFAGPLLARFGKVSFPHPGGDVIGPRPINLFLDGFKKMGCEVSLENERYAVNAKDGLQGAEFFFMFVSVTGTETLMMAATLAKGKTILKNAAMEPEIAALAEFLNSCGARIRGAGTPTIEIEGGSMLKAQGKELRIVPDRIEAGTFMLLGALAAKELEITDCQPAHCEMLVQLLRESGISIMAEGSRIIVKDGGEALPLNIRTHEYPGFATDLQPPMVVYLTQAAGESTMFETIWGGRLGYTQDLIKMGADITLWNPQQISIKGKTPLRGHELESPDIRAGLAFLLAAAVAEGKSTIGNIYHIDRGYERIEERLQKLGLNIKREQI
ncbi:MAG: UDP-N-acetylglucosamine 1-carboxyvinyltransferase [Patescibacteria group bacterium]|nr:UDP-N-acetylglucosamine 1-carboxyvinyltransferase [Patescibacteria group bacterium]